MNILKIKIKALIPILKWFLLRNSKKFLNRNFKNYENNLK